MIDEIKFDGKNIYINDMKQDMSNTLNFLEFETIHATTKYMNQIACNLFEISEKMDKIPQELYTEIIRLHNAAVDYMEVYKSLTKEKSNDLHKKNKETE